MLSSKAIATEREYLCKFTTAQGSIFATVTDAEKTGLSDLSLDEEDEENDNNAIPLEDITDERIFDN